MSFTLHAESFTFAAADAVEAYPGDRNTFVVCSYELDSTTSVRGGGLCVYQWQSAAPGLTRCQELPAMGMLDAKWYVWELGCGAQPVCSS